MQYILSQEELENLIPKQELDNFRKELKTLQAALEWARDKIARKCIHTHGEEHIMYCDECPLSDTGGRKHRPSRKISEAICTLDREYSK